MQDRPRYEELLAAVQGFLEQEVMPASEGSRRFMARVAVNVLRIVRRELELEDEQLAAEWAGLEGLLGPAQRPQHRSALREALLARNEELCQRIRRGDADEDPYRGTVLAHVRGTVRDKLLVSNPRWIGEEADA